MKRYKKIILLVVFVFLLLLGTAFAILPLPGKIPVLMYHFVGTSEEAKASSNVVSRESFEQQMNFLHRYGYRVISLEDYYKIKTGQKKSTGREIAIAFDDNDKSFVQNAYPILSRYEFPVTLFAITQNLRTLHHGSMDIPTMRRLLKRPWISLGAHTRTHPVLTEKSKVEILRELRISKKELEQWFQRPVLDLAYPSGALDERVIQLAALTGYRQAFTTSPKKLKGIREGIFSQNRVKITHTSDIPFVFWLHVSGIYGSYKEWRYKFKHNLF